MDLAFTNLGDREFQMLTRKKVQLPIIVTDWFDQFFMVSSVYEDLRGRGVANLQKINVKITQTMNNFETLFQVAFDSSSL